MLPVHATTSVLAHIRGWLGPGQKLLLPLGSLLCFTKNMKKARTIKHKVMGRPRTGIRPLLGCRADATTRAAIVKWSKNEPDKPNLSEAIRRLVDLGLARSKARLPSPESAGRAKQLAATTLDSLVDPAAPTEQVAYRKERLLKGPEEFRQMRINRERKI